MKQCHLLQKLLFSLFYFMFLLDIPIAMNAPKSDSLSVLLMSDTHICNLNGYHPQFEKSRQHYGNGIEPLENFLSTKPDSLNVDAVVITGDLIDYYEAETYSDRLLATQIEQFTPIANLCPVPLYLTLGNHDIASYWIVESDSSKENFQINAHKARAAWIRNIPCFQNGTYYARSFKVGDINYRFLFLDNGYSLNDNGRWLDKVQLDWLNYQLKNTGGDPVIIFMHKYLPVADENNDGIVFSTKWNLTIDKETCSKGFLKILNDNKNIKALFVGHGHRNVSENILLPNGHKIMQIETGGFAQNTKNWRLLKFTRDNLFISSPGGENIEKVIKIK